MKFWCLRILKREICGGRKQIWVTWRYSNIPYWCWIKFQIFFCSFLILSFHLHVIFIHFSFIRLLHNEELRRNQKKISCSTPSHIDLLTLQQSHHHNSLENLWFTLRNCFLVTFNAFVLNEEKLLRFRNFQIEKLKKILFYLIFNLVFILLFFIFFFRWKRRRLARFSHFLMKILN